MQKKKRIREKGTGTIVKNRGRFYLKVRIGSTTKSTLLRGADDNPVTTRVDAERAAALLRPVLRAEQKEEIAIHIANAKKLRQSGSLPIDKIWETYLAQYQRPDSSESTLKSYNKALRLFSEWLGQHYPRVQYADRITPEHAGKYFSYIWTVRKVSGRTFNSYRQALKLIFKHIMEPAGLDENPFACITTKPVFTESRHAFTEEQVRAIFAGFDTGFYYNTEVLRMGPGRKHIRVERKLQYKPMYSDEMKVLLTLCCWTGCRGQDGCLMQWSNVDFKTDTITYIPQKTARKTNNRSVTLPLHPELRKALHESEAFRNRNKRREDYIIPSVAARYKRNPDGIQKDVRKIIHCATGCEVTASDCPEHRVNRANLYSLHSFRHTFVSFCANAGVPLDIVAAIVGHGSSAMTRHYAHISAEAKNRAIEALPMLQQEEKPQTTADKREQLYDRLSLLSEEQISGILGMIDQMPDNAKRIVS